jgi:hypothetical protein
MKPINPVVSMQNKNATLCEIQPDDFMLDRTGNKCIEIDRFLQEAFNLFP